MRTTKITQAIFGKQHAFRFFLFFIGFYLINFWVNKSHIFYASIKNVTPWFAISFIIINFLLAALVATTINLTIMRYQETRFLSKQEGSAITLGFIASIIGGGCPACFVGVLPALISFFGIAISFDKVPLLGLTIQVISAIILLISIYLLSGPIICKNKPTKNT